MGMLLQEVVVLGGGLYHVSFHSGEISLVSGIG